MGVLSPQTQGTFRIRHHENGDLEVWVQGWRLEFRFLSIVPALLTIGFAFSSIFLPVRILGVLGLAAATVVFHRLTRVGIRLTATGITFHDLLQTRSIPWDHALTFMGERTRHDGKLMLLLKDGSKVAGPGSLTGEDMNPIGDEGDLSVVEELNRLTERFRRGLPVSAPPPIRAATDQSRLRVRARGPRTRPRAPESPRAAAVPDEQGFDVEPTYAPPVQDPPPLRHPHVPRPPKPEPEPEPTGRSGRRARRRARGAASPALIQVPDADSASPGARLLSSLEEREQRH